MELTKLRPTLEEMVNLLSIEKKPMSAGLSSPYTLELVPSKWLKERDIESVSLKFDNNSWTYERSLIFPSFINGKEYRDRGFILCWSNEFFEGNYPPRIVFDHNLPIVPNLEEIRSENDLITVRTKYDLPLEVYFKQVHDEAGNLQGHIVLFRNPSAKIGIYYYFSPEVVILSQRKYSDDSKSF